MGFKGLLEGQWFQVDHVQKTSVGQLCLLLSLNDKFSLVPGCSDSTPLNALTVYVQTISLVMVAKVHY